MRVTRNSAPPSSPPFGATPGNRRGSVGSAFWVMTRRVAMLAACVDLAFLVFFLAAGSPFLAWINLISIGMYVTAYALLTRRHNLPAIVLIWIEVVAHSVIGTLLTGWDSGFHYYLLMFIPATVVSGGRRNTVTLLCLFVFYASLFVASEHYGAMAPLSEQALLTLNVFNVAMFFTMAAYTAHFYYNLVRKSERKLQELATRDALTGLSNRRHWLDVAQQEVARAARTGDALSLVLVDIDDFKQINDGFSHDAGDQVLIYISRFFRELCGPRMTVARWGGEEFLFLLPSTSRSEAREFAERVRREVSTLGLEYGGALIGFSVSLGVATWTEREKINETIGRADDALYRSKGGGRDRVTEAIHPEPPHNGVFSAKSALSELAETP